jgi:hypothetical protein
MTAVLQWRREQELSRVAYATEQQQSPLLLPPLLLLQEVLLLP